MFPQQDFFWTDPNFEERERRDERETERARVSCCAGLVTRVSEGERQRDNQTGAKFTASHFPLGSRDDTEIKH